MTFGLRTMKFTNMAHAEHAKDFNAYAQRAEASGIIEREILAKLATTSTLAPLT